MTARLYSAFTEDVRKNECGAVKQTECVLGVWAAMGKPILAADFNSLSPLVRLVKLSALAPEDLKHRKHFVGHQIHLLPLGRSRKRPEIPSSAATLSSLTMFDRRAMLITTLVAVAVGLVVMAVVETHKLAVPISTWIPMSNALFALITILSYFSSSKIFSMPYARLVMIALCYILLALPPVLTTYAAQYIFSPTVTICRLETQWSNLFRAKDEAAIESIQRILQCCGFKSTPDRAWPFPSRTEDAHACERTLGFSIPCAPMWHGRLITTAALNMAASMILGTAGLLTVYRVAGKDVSMVPTPASAPVDEVSRLLEERRDFEEYAAAIGSRRRSE